MIVIYPTSSRRSTKGLATIALLFFFPLLISCRHASSPGYNGNSKSNNVADNPGDSSINHEKRILQETRNATSKSNVAVINDDFPLIAQITFSSKNASEPPEYISRFEIFGEEISENGESIVMSLFISDRTRLEQLINDGYDVSIDMEEMKRLRNDDVESTERNQSSNLRLNNVFSVSSSSSEQKEYSNISFRQCFRDVKGAYQTVHDIIANDDNNIASLIKIGESYLKSKNPNDGHDLIVLKITGGNNNTPSPKPIFFIMSGLHARELAPVELSLQFAEKIVSLYGVDPDATTIIDNTEIHFLFHANPDGRIHVENEPFWAIPRRKNMNFEANIDGSDYCGYFAYYSEAGVDLNRNFPFMWPSNYGSSIQPCDWEFRGQEPGSEPEVKAVVEYVTSLFPERVAPGIITTEEDIVVRDDDKVSSLFFDLHSYGDLLIHPYVYQNRAPGHSNGFAALSNKFKTFKSYKLAGGGSDNFLYEASGTSMDWAYSALGMASFTFEIGQMFYEGCQRFKNKILPDNLPLLFYAAKVARAPFEFVRGPDVVSLSVPFGDGTYDRSQSLFVDARVSVRPGQHLQSVQIYFDEYPYDDGASSGNTMMKGEGVDTVAEMFWIEVFMSDFELGRHIFHVQATDTDGFVGPITSQFFTII